MSVTVRALCCVALFAAAMTEASAQKKSEPSKYPGTMVFRCPYEVACASLLSPDRALGDDNASNYGLLPDASAGVGIYRIFRDGSELPSGEMHYNPGPATNNFSVTLDFSEPDGSVCSLYGCFPYTGQTLAITTKMEIATNVLDANGEEAAAGLFSIPLNGSAMTRFWFNFTDPNPLRETGWRVRFASAEFEGATDIKVTRTAVCTWEIEAGPDDRAGLWGYEAPPGKRRAQRVDYGLFKMPFKLTFTAYDAPIPGSTQSCPAKP